MIPSRNFHPYVQLLVLAGFAAVAYAQLPVQSRPPAAADTTAALVRDFQGSIPSTHSIAHRGVRIGKSFRFPAGKMELGLPDLPATQYYSPNYGLMVEFNTGFTWQEWEKKGNTMHSFASISHKQRDAKDTPPPAKVYTMVAEQNVLPDTIRHELFLISDLDKVAKELWRFVKLDPRMGYYIPNIEQSGLFYPPGSKSREMSQSDWDKVKDTVITKESGKGGKVTLEELHKSHQWNVEMGTRYTNRYLLLRALVKARNPKVKWSFGSSIQQGEPSPDGIKKITIPMPEERGNVRVLTGRNDDKFTFADYDGKQHTVEIPQECYFWGEDVHLDYDYPFYFKIGQQDYDEIYVQKLPKTQSYPYLWSKMQPFDVGGWLKGRWQILMGRLRNYPGLKQIPVIHMAEVIYEGNESAIIATPEGRYIKSANGRVPFKELQETKHGKETPKTWLPPGHQYSIYAWHRFLNNAGGAYLWNGGGYFEDLKKHPMYNQVLHPVSALFQAKVDLQPLEYFFEKSTLVEDPEVSLQGESKFETYSGVDAFSGKQKRPAYSLRYYSVAGRTLVAIIGSCQQAEGKIRTDRVRLPAGGLIKTEFEVTLNGPWAHVFVFAMPGQGDGKLWKADAGASKAPPGYAGFAQIVESR